MSHSRFRTLFHAAACATLPVVLAACGSSTPSTPTTPTLKVTAVSPSTGSTTGGTALTITGTGFASDAVVMVGGVQATGVTVTGTTSIAAVTAVRPTAGAADISISSGGKTTSLVNGFTFVAPSGSNQPPVIRSIVSVGSRTNQPSGFSDIDETVQVNASVSDVETPVSSLVFDWSGPGSLTPLGSSLSWKLPSSFASGTPSTATLTLKATEKFTEGGVTHQQASTQTFAMRVHDSQKEILDAGQDFLTLFSDSKYSTNDVLHNFSTTCDSGRGRSSEASDVDKNRRDFVQDFSKFTISRRPPVTFNFKGSCGIPDGRVQRNVDACSSFTVHWEVTVKADGTKDITDGIDYVSAVLENDRWLLCHSDFIGTSRKGLTGEIRAVAW